MAHTVRARAHAAIAPGIAIAIALLGCDATPRAAAVTNDPLPSWHDSAAKRTIVEFVARVTQRGSPDFVPPSERIAVFDNDGTLWVEQPVYTQVAFALDRVKELAPEHPEWANQQPFKAVLEGDPTAIAASGERGIVELIAATHANNTTDEFTRIVMQWFARARHPRFDQPYTMLTYAPMLELLAYLRAHGFSTFVVSGGGVEFMRPWTELIYGIPPQQVVGSRGKLEYRYRNGEPVLFRRAEIDLVDDKAGKPIGIQQQIGRRPILAFGNSDGDFEMLEWTTTGPGRRLGLLLHHTDGVREYAYDRASQVGRLARGLDEAAARNWIIVDMKRDWKKVFRWERSPADASVRGASAAAPGS